MLWGMDDSTKDQKALSVVTMEDIENEDSRIWQIFDSVPKGNSDAQIKYFVANEHSKSRAYRALVMEIRNDALILKDEEFTRRKLMAAQAKCRAEIKIRQLKIDRLKKPDFMQRIMLLVYPKGYAEQQILVLQAEIDEQQAQLERETFNLQDTDILIRDSKRRIQVACEMMEKIGTFTREEFEAAEPQYWQSRLTTRLKMQYLCSGTAGSMDFGHLMSLNQLTGGDFVEDVLLLKGEVNLRSATLLEGAKEKAKELAPGNSSQGNEDRS